MQHTAAGRDWDAIDAAYMWAHRLRVFLLSSRDNLFLRRRELIHLYLLDLWSASVSDKSFLIFLYLVAFIGWSLIKTLTLSHKHTFFALKQDIEDDLATISIFFAQLQASFMFKTMTGSSHWKGQSSKSSKRNLHEQNCSRASSYQKENVITGITLWFGRFPSDKVQ